MSKYIPKYAVLKESLMQFKRRAYIERSLKADLDRIKVSLKANKEIGDDLLALGITYKHAFNIAVRLKSEIENEERRAALSKNVPEVSK